MLIGIILFTRTVESRISNPGFRDWDLESRISNPGFRDPRSRISTPDWAEPRASTPMPSIASRTRSGGAPRLWESGSGPRSCRATSPRAG